MPAYIIQDAYTGYILACACIMRGQQGAASWLLQFMRAWQYACAAHDAESAVQA